jgi:iron complex outermembrane recepter protein
VRSQSPPPPLVVREQVEVVATRLPEAPHDVPVSVEVIDGDTLRAIGATNLREALSLAAGVEVGPGGDAGPASAVPEFWGLREFDAFLLVVDDIPWGGAFNPSLATLNLHDVERIEVLRGSAPVTYGATSFVGVIHVVHTAAAADRSYASVRGGTFTSGGAAIDLAMPSSGAWKSRVSADVDRQGFKDDRTSFKRGHASYRAANTGQDRKTWFSADFNWLGQQPASPHVREGTALTTATPLDANYNPAGAFLDDTRLTFAFGTERPVMNDARWTTTASYSHLGQSIFRGFLTDVSNTANNATGFREDIDVHDIYADTHVTWPMRSHVRVVAGGDFLFGNGEGTGATFTYTVPLSGAASTVTEPTTLNLDTGSRRAFSGGYAQVEWTPSTRWHLSSGVRLNVTWERHGEGGGATHARPAGSVGAIVGVWEQGANHVRLFANYRDTFKPAAFDFSLAENEGVLDPETARSYEGGVKLRAAGGRVDVEASGFRMDFKNLVTATVVAGLPSLQNAGSTRFQGFEIAADARAPRGITGRATYSFHDGTFVDFVRDFGGTNTQLAGKRFEMSARHLFSAGLIMAPSRAGLVGDVIVKYAGDRYLDKRNRALASPFTTVDIGVGYRLDRWELRLDGRNLGDTRDPISESELGDAQYYRLPARRLDVAVGLRF